jgi:hypothetical protein
MVVVVSVAAVLEVRCVWTDGALACPSCGGPPGYADLLEVVADPAQEHEHLRSWVGGPFSPEEFDLALANARLQTFRRIRRSSSLKPGPDPARIPRGSRGQYVPARAVT